MFVSHPSSELSQAFSENPYQGSAPEQAHFLFIGLDANYDINIEASPIFPKLLEYHADGVAFWRKHGVHHPFLLAEYSGDGRFYHRSFARIGFSAAQANCISFVECLHVPTVGRSHLVAEDLDRHHLEWLNAVILEGAARHIFIPCSVANLLRKSPLFAWLPRTPDKSGPLGIWFQQGSKTVYSHLHFSVYGKFEARKAAEIAAISSLVLAAASNR